MHLTQCSISYSNEAIYVSLPDHVAITVAMTTEVPNLNNDVFLTWTKYLLEPKPWCVPKPDQVVFVPKPNQTLTTVWSH